MRKAAAAISFLAVAVGSPCSLPAASSAAIGTSADVAPATPKATYPEVPYYLNKLKETQLEGERVDLNKLIHDALVTADISDKKVVKEMTPIVAQVEAAIAAGLDRPYLEGKSDWLASAVNYFKKEKLRPSVDVPEMYWGQPQTTAQSGLRISTYPDKILLHDGPKTRTATESSNIHEAVISPDGRKIAYFRTTDDEKAAEIWVVDVRSLKRKKVSSAASCLTLLFTPNGSRILFQEVPNAPDAEAPLYSVGTGGGKKKEISQIRLLQTTVAKGDYAGNIVVYKALPHHLGTTIRDCAVLISPSGKEIGRLKDGPCR